MTHDEKTRLDGPAPAVTKPLAGYLRLTQDRHGNKIGYDVQMRAINAQATALGMTIGQWYKDKDITAADLDVERPEYEQMLRDVESGRWGGVMVWRLDRLVRLTREFERCWGVVQDSGGHIISIEPLISTKDSIGLMLMRILVMMAEMEIDSMRVRQRGHQRARAEAGKAGGGGHRPFGFVGWVKDDEGMVLNPGRFGVDHHPVEAPLLREAARRVAWEGESYTDVIKDWLNRDPPIVGTTGSPWVAQTLQQALTSPRVVGLREHKTVDPVTGEKRVDLFPAEWDPILDKETWDRLRALKVARPRKGRPYSYLLSGGIALCGNSGCGKRMIGSPMRTAAGDVNGYICDNSVAAVAQGGCGSNKIYAKIAEEYVLESILARLSATPEMIDSVADETNGLDPRVDTALDTIAECDRKLEEFAKLAALPPERGGITTQEWLVFRTSVWDQREAAKRIVEAARTVQVIPTPIGSERDNMREWFEGLTITQQRAFVRAHVRAVVIKKGKRGGSVAARAVATLGRVEIVFSDAKHVDGRGDDAGITDRDLDALLGTDAR